MGEIADAMINGDLDYQTGEYLGEGMGFPRTQNHRGFSTRNQKRIWYYDNEQRYRYYKIHTKGYMPSNVNGVLFYLGSYYEIRGMYPKALKVIKQYCNHIGFNVKGKSHKSIMTKACNKIQEDFDSFKDWCEENLQRKAPQNKREK